MKKENFPALASAVQKRLVQAEARTLKAETRTEQAESRTEQAEARTESAKTRAEAAETRAEQAESRTEQAKTRTERAEVRSEQAETALEDCLHHETRHNEVHPPQNGGVPQAASSKANPLEPLTPRQRETLQLIAEGQNTKQIAHSLGISPKTVEYHRLKLMGVLNIHDVPGLVRFAMKAGLVAREL